MVVKHLDSIKRLTDSLTKYDPRSDIDDNEVELFQLGNGGHFGEWGLIYNLVRTTSVLTVEDTEFFTLDKDTFLGSFGVYK